MRPPVSRPDSCWPAGDTGSVTSAEERDAAGDPEAGFAGVPPDLAALYQRHHARLRRVAFAALPLYLHSEVDVALMTVFCRLLQLESRDELPQPSSWEAYLVRAVKNVCVDMCRVRRDDRHAEFDASALDHDSFAGRRRDGLLDPTADMAVEGMDAEGRRERVRLAVGSLDERARVIVIGSLDGLSNAELGRQLGISGQRVGQLYRQALEQLREELSRRDD